ncbi:SDR family NAD(P)-dependent oxidoreductase [Hyphomonas oceanitis]|uniref:SDR family NAD(P)-dependent oxidoreductase n=1 Tax=Hyphomonas oceanitis TaxID=81033 RepID=UPI003003534C
MSKTAIITGGSSGMGAAAAIALAGRGVQCIVTYNSSQQGALDVVSAIRQQGGQAAALHLDVGRSETFAAFRSAVASILDSEWQANGFDYLVNNAGFGRMAMFEETSEDLFDEFSRVLLKGPYFLTQALLGMLHDGGAIVNVASNSALTTGMTAGYSAYGAMKGGLIVLTRYMAKEFAARNIRVNAVSPGPTRTGMIPDNVMESYPDVITALVEATAFNRLGESEDIGRVIASLLSDDFGWVTGQSIEASGGYRL